MSKKKIGKGKYNLFLTLASWHYKRGYIIEYAHPSGYVVPKSHLEMLFFYSLHIKQRRVEPMIRQLSVGDKKYTFFYYGAFEEKPTLLIVESDYKHIKPLVEAIAALLKWNGFYRYEKTRLEALNFENIINFVPDERLALVIISMAMGLYDLLLKELIETPEITIGDFLDKTSAEERPPTRMEIETILKALSWAGLTNIRFDRRVLDFKVQLKALPVLYLNLTQNEHEKLKRKISTLKDNRKFYLSSLLHLAKREESINEILHKQKELIHGNLEMLHKISHLLLNNDFYKLFLEVCNKQTSKDESQPVATKDLLKHLRRIGLDLNYEGKFLLSNIELALINLKNNKILRKINICDLAKEL